jgi:hypothetical protein
MEAIEKRKSGMRSSNCSVFPLQRSWLAIATMRSHPLALADEIWPTSNDPVEATYLLIADPLSAKPVSENLFLRLEGFGMPWWKVYWDIHRCLKSG